MRWPVGLKDRRARPRFPFTVCVTHGFQNREVHTGGWSPVLSVCICRTASNVHMARERGLLGVVHGKV